MPRQSLLSRSQSILSARPQSVIPGTTTQVELINGRLIAYDDNINNYIVKGYNVNDVIYSIVNLICNKIRVAKWGVYAIEDESAYKTLKLIQSHGKWTAKDFVKARDAQYKALKPVANSGKWGELTQWANEDTTFSDYMANLAAWKLITGNYYAQATPLKGGVNIGTPYELNYLPSQYTSIVASDTFPARAIGYYNSVVPDMRWTSEEILHGRDLNMNWDVNGVQLYGMARLKAGLMRLQKNNSLTRAEAATFGNEGIKGLMYIDADPGVMDYNQNEPALTQLKKTMVGEWQGTQNRGRIGIASQRMGYIPIGMTSEEMEVIESGMVDLRYFCNLFDGVPSQLLNDPQNKVYANVTEGEKALTSRCALPHMISQRDRFTKKAVDSWGLPKGQVIDFDMTGYPELQADVKETAEWTSKIIAISPNEQRELCGLGALPGKDMNEPWVLSLGRQPKSVYDMTQVDNALNEDEPAADNSDKPGDK